ncbi:mitochondrial import inner membrane translocase subunit tim16 [Hordeum vulgare]|nr:mitochondrial import inner membrane translocase subunit tim16 [Hordeum vulgare]
MVRTQDMTSLPGKKKSPHSRTRLYHRAEPVSGTRQSPEPARERFAAAAGVKPPGSDPLRPPNTNRLAVAPPAPPQAAPPASPSNLGFPPPPDRGGGRGEGEEQNQSQSEMAGRLLGQLLVMGGAVVGRAVVQAYRQAIVNAQRTGAAQEAVNGIRRASKAMTEQEARQILGISEKTSWEEIVQV